MGETAQEIIFAIGWAKMSDFSARNSGREAFKAKVARFYPDAKPSAIQEKIRGRVPIVFGTPIALCVVSRIGAALGREVKWGNRQGGERDRIGMFVSAQR